MTTEPGRRSIVSRTRGALSGQLLASRQRARRLFDEAGMTTAEYAVGTVAACGFAGLLYKLLTSGPTSTLLGGLIRRALTGGF